MTKKYHISKKSGRPNICTAQTPASCTADPAFGEDKPPHFENKDQAKQYVEEKMSAQYGNLSSTQSVGASKSANKEVSAQEKVKEHIEQLDSMIDDRFDDPYMYFQEKGFNVHNMVRQIDYRNELILEKDSQYYAADVYGGDIMDYELLRANPVRKSSVSKIDATLKNEDSINDKEILDSVAEFNEHQSVFYEFFNRSTLDDGKEGKKAVSVGRVDSVHEREDGTKIYGFSLTPEGDTSIYDKPSPVSLGIDLYENEERQNGRIMEEGYAVYDTRTEKGVLFVYRTGSEEGSSNDFLYDKNKSIEPEDSFGYQSVYSIQGTGEQVEGNYWER